MKHSKRAPFTAESREGNPGCPSDSIGTDSIRIATELSAAEAASVISAGRLEEFQPIAPLGSWELDVRANQIQGSDRFFYIFDLPPSAAALPFGKLMDSIPATDQERVNKTVHCAVETHEPFDLEHRVVHRGGTVRVVRSCGQVVTDLTGGSMRLVGTTVDITDGKRAGEELHQSEERLRSLVANIPDVVWTSDATGNPIFVTPNCERVYGYTPEETCKPGFFFSRIHPDDYASVARTHNVFFTGHGSFDEEFRIQRKDGQWIWIRDRAVASYEKDGKLYTDGTICDITERKRAEEALRESEAELKEALLAAQMGVWEWTETTDTVTWDENLYRIAGRDPQLPAPSYQEQQQIFDLKSWERLKAAVENALATGTPYELDLQLVRPDGSKRWLIARGEPRRDANGNITRLRGTVQDITERKRAEEELHRSRQMLQSVLDNIPQRVFWKDRNSLYLGCNRAFATDAGLNHPAEIVGKSDFDLPWSRTADVYRADDRVVMEQEFAKLNFDEFESRPNGVLFWRLTNKLPLRDREGKVTGVIGTYEDVTERKRTEEALRASEERVRLLLESTAEAIYGIDLDGKCTFANPACLRILGYATQEDLLGKDLHKLLHHSRADGRSFPVAECRIRRSIDREEPSHVDDEVMWRADRTSFPAEYWSHPVRREGKVIGTVVTFLDITERKQAEQEMRKAKEAAEAANQAKSQFLANMSHEIRTPMNGVIGMAGLLLDTELTPEQQQYAEIVRSSGEALLTVINDILDFSKIEARKLLLEVTDFNLQTVLEDAAAVLALKASEKGLELTCETEPGTPLLLQGDPDRFRQVLVNLLGNAVKFTPQGEIAIRVRLETEDDGRVTLRFTVRDTGIGFRPDRAADLFVPFVQGDGSPTRRYGGTGLGLAISKQLVEMMGGQIGVESEEGKGSAFWFTATFEKQPQASAPVAEVLPHLQDTKVLVVDDNATNRSLVSRLLNSWGCRAQEAADGNSALKILRQAVRVADPFHTVLLDLGLPGMDGEELGRRIAADPQLRHTARILMTGFGQRRQSDDGRLQALGFAGHVSKPIWERTLREALLPLSKKPSRAVCPAQHMVTPPSAGRANSRARILVVEDNVSNQDVAVAILNKLGYRADLAANGVEALGALRVADFDLVLMDCEMPEMDGYQATRCIREQRTGMRNPQVPIIALTADAISGDREKCLQAGMNDYFAKPIRAEQLADSLEKWLIRPPRGEVNAPVDLTPAISDPVFNQKDLLDRLMGDKGLASKVIAGFLNDFPRQLHTLKNRLAAGDAHGVRLQAHTLKGASATVAAEALRAVCFKAQEAAASGELHRVEDLLPQMEEQFNLLKVTLKRSGWV